MKPVLRPGSTVGIDTEMVSRFPMIEVFGQHSILDENFELQYVPNLLRKIEYWPHEQIEHQPQYHQ